METILVTGANRGIGLEFVKQYSQIDARIIACYRSIKNSDELVQESKKNARISLHQLDVSVQNSIDQLAKDLQGEKIDILINNAGSSGISGVTINNIDRENFLNLMNINCIGVIKTTEALLPHIESSNKKQVVVISSQMGSISDNSSGKSYAYRASKAAVHCAMRSLAIDVADRGIKVLLIHPGWVKTEMGGSNALINTEESVKGMLDQIQQYGPFDQAQVIRRFDGKTISW